MIMSGLDTYFLEVSVHALLKVATKGSFRGKKCENVAFLGYFSQAKMEECNQIVWSVCSRFGIIIPCSAKYFLKVGKCVSLSVPTKVFLEVKKTWKFEKLLNLKFLDYFSKTKTEECDQEDWSVSNKFGIITPCTATYHIEVGAPASMKAATKASLRVKKISENLLDFHATFLKPKRRSDTNKIGVTVKNLAWFYLAQLHIFWMLVHAFHWK